MTLTEALDALEADSAFKQILGEKVVDVFVLMKRDEVERYEQATADPTTRDVTAWEIQEYLEDF